MPFGATFLVFADYMRPPMRLSAIAHLRSIWVYTHDSIGVGEDGPTHQPVEQIASLRAIPGMIVMRPCDANETRVRLAGRGREPRRPDGAGAHAPARPDAGSPEPRARRGLRRGAYVLNEGAHDPELILIATGSEVRADRRREARLRQSGLRVRLVSMPSWELFERAGRRPIASSVLPRAVKARLAVEAARSFGWERWVGSEGDIVSVDRFGASAPGERVLAGVRFHRRQRRRAGAGAGCADLSSFVDTAAA